MSEWISVKDGMPPLEERVIISFNHSDAPHVTLGYLVTNWCREVESNDPPVWWFEWNGNARGALNVTHWMPLPDAPKVAE